MISEAEQSQIMNELLAFVKSVTPIDTGNMRYNAVQLKSLGGGKWQIVVNADIAPYVPYTNEPWISPKWNGKKNPNEHWWEDTAENVTMLLAQRMRGEIKRS